MIETGIFLKYRNYKTQQYFVRVLVTIWEFEKYCRFDIRYYQKARLQVVYPIYFLHLHTVCNI